MGAVVREEVTPHNTDDCHEYDTEWRMTYTYIPRPDAEPITTTVGSAPHSTTKRMAYYIAALMAGCAVGMVIGAALAMAAESVTVHSKALVACGAIVLFVAATVIQWWQDRETTTHTRKDQ